jgi:hypothetical protein
MMALDDAHALEAERLVRIARTKAHLGRREQAIARYDDALALRPGLEQAFLEIVDLLEAGQDWLGIAQRCETWISHFPDHSSHGLSDRVHNLRIDALSRVGGIDLAYEAYGLQQVTSGPVELDDDEIVMIVVAHNEATRIPFLLEYHRRLGVNRFLVIDNGSDDASIEYLGGQPDTIVWSTSESYLRSNCGVSWTDLILRRYVTRQWCLAVDADELFVYPGVEHRGLRELCAALDRAGATCYPALMLDMYGDGRLSEATYRPGQDPLEVFPYFDRAYYRLRIPFDGPRRNMTNYWGGVRARIFGGGLGGYLVHKVPLFRYSPGEVLMSGYHWLDRPIDEVAGGRGGVLHFKFSSTFIGSVAEEVARKEHARGASVYELYSRGLEARPDPVFFDPMHSVRFESSEQLVAMGVMREDAAHNRVAVTRDSVLIPVVPPRATSTNRPFWSVVVVSAEFDDVGTRGRVEGVLRALDIAPPSEVVIVSGLGCSRDAATWAGSCSSGNHSIVIVPTEQYLNEVELTNLGLCHTRGSWVHVLGSRAVQHHFYRVIGDAIADGHTELAVAQPDERERCLDLDFMLRASRFAARRHLYERAGGFCATVPFAASWEMLQRLAHAAPDAQAQVSVPPHDPEGPGPYLSGVFPGYGEEVVHWLAAIDLVRDLADLSPPDVAALHNRCAMRAADLVRDDIEHGRFASALATIGEALRVPIAPSAREHLIANLIRTL